MRALLISSLIAAFLGFAAAWTWQDDKIKTLELDYANERISLQRAARASIERAAEQAVAAQNAATARAVGLRQSADAARGELDRLRVATDESLRAAATSAQACTERAAAIGGLLNNCAREYQALGERADRHVNDIKALIAAP